MFSSLFGLKKNGNKYCNDGNNNSFPWYRTRYEKADEFITIEGPTNKYSIVHIVVCTVFLFNAIFPYCSLNSKYLEFLSYCANNHLILYTFCSFNRCI